MTPTPEPTDRCAWCGSTYEEHSGPIQDGCESFIPIDWRAKAHIILGRIIDDPSRMTAFAIGDLPWVTATLRLRGAVIRAHEEENR